MDTNNSSAIRRFGEYLLFDLKTNIAAAGLSTLAFGLIPVIAFAAYALLCTSVGDKDWMMDLEVNFIIAATASVLYFLTLPITCYGYLTEKRKGTQFLMFPASHTEKYISMVLSSVIIFPIAFTIIYLSSDALLATIFPSRYEGTIVGELVNTLQHNSSNLLIIFLPCMVSSAGLAGAMLFRKNKMAKTFLTSAVSFIVFIMIAVSVLDKLYGCMEIDLNSSSWYIFQTFCAICCLTYVYFKTKKIQL